MKRDLLQTTLLALADAAWQFGDDLRNDPYERDRACAAARYLETQALLVHRTHDKNE